MKMVEASRPKRLRTIRQFAEQEIRLTTGPYAGRPFRIHRQPWTGHWFDAIDSGRWRRMFLTSAVQSVKTWAGSIIPTCWHVFERCEDIIFGVPSMDMVKDKWHDDLLPVIEASRFRDLLPRRGAGSKSGTPKRIQFAHGPAIRFMTAGGNDKARAGKTSRVLIVTETDAFSVVGGSSDEGDKFSQLEARLSAWGDAAILYAECTISTEEATTWKEIKGGTNSRLAIRCAECRAFVTPEREHLLGWKNAKSDVEAFENSCVVCPKCGCEWSEDQRVEANRGAVLVHEGQTCDETGAIHGEAKKTTTLGFRATCVNNLLKKIGEVGAKEWKAAQSPDPENDERTLRQFYWAMPSEPDKRAVVKLEAGEIAKRILNYGRSELPPDTQRIVVGMDVGLRLCHWTAIAIRPDAKHHVFEYGREAPAIETMDSERAILTALRDWRDNVILNGWTFKEKSITPFYVLIDSGNWTKVVYTFCNESGPPFYPVKGFGAKEAGRQKDFGAQMWRASIQDDGTQLILANADAAKSFVHSRLKTPPLDDKGGEMPGAMTLFRPMDAEVHRTFTHQILAERQYETTIDGKKTVTVWQELSRNNHYLDSTAIACVAGEMSGSHIVTPYASDPRDSPPPKVSEQKPPSWVERPKNWI